VAAYYCRRCRGVHYRVTDYQQYQPNRLMLALGLILQVVAAGIVLGVVTWLLVALLILVQP
jgi:hypothetical protein